LISAWSLREARPQRDGGRAAQGTSSPDFPWTTSDAIRVTFSEKGFDPLAQQRALLGIGILGYLARHEEADKDREGFPWFLRLELKPVITQVGRAGTIPEQ
jgi:hypothetical protein